METIRALLKKYRELILYLVFGVLTTLVNYVSWWVIEPFFASSTVPVTILV